MWIACGAPKQEPPATRAAEPRPAVTAAATPAAQPLDAMPAPTPVPRAPWAPKVLSPRDAKLAAKLSAWIEPQLKFLHLVQRGESSPVVTGLVALDSPLAVVASSVTVGEHTCSNELRHSCTAHNYDATIDKHPQFDGIAIEGAFIDDKLFLLAVTLQLAEHEYSRDERRVFAPAFEAAVTRWLGAPSYSYVDGDQWESMRIAYEHLGERGRDELDVAVTRGITVNINIWGRTADLYYARVAQEDARVAAEAARVEAAKRLARCDCKHMIVGDDWPHKRGGYDDHLGVHNYHVLSVSPATCSAHVLETNLGSSFETDRSCSDFVDPPPCGDC